MTVVLLALSGACSLTPKPPISATDWTTSFRGAGNVPTRMINEGDEPIVVRIEDFYGNIAAQVPLDGRRIETVYLPTGNVRAIVRVVRNGVPRDSGGEMFNVPGETLAVEWRFSAPPP